MNFSRLLGFGPLILLSCSATQQEPTHPADEVSKQHSSTAPRAAKNEAREIKEPREAEDSSTSVDESTLVFLCTYPGFNPSTPCERAGLGFTDRRSRGNRILASEEAALSQRAESAARSLEQSDSAEPYIRAAHQFRELAGVREYACLGAAVQSQSAEAGKWQQLHIEARREAVTYYESALEKDPTLTHLEYSAGLDSLSVGDWVRAQMHFARFLDTPSKKAHGGNSLSGEVLSSQLALLVIEKHVGKPEAEEKLRTFQPAAYRNDARQGGLSSDAAVGFARCEAGHLAQARGDRSAAQKDFQAVISAKVSEKLRLVAEEALERIQINQALGL